MFFNWGDCPLMDESVDSGESGFNDQEDGISE